MRTTKEPVCPGAKLPWKGAGEDSEKTQGTWLGHIPRGPDQNRNLSSCVWRRRLVQASLLTGWYTMSNNNKQTLTSKCRIHVHRWARTSDHYKVFFCQTQEQTRRFVSVFICDLGLKGRKNYMVQPRVWTLNNNYTPLPPPPPELDWFKLWSRKLSVLHCLRNNRG